ncbi:MAG: YegP family protein [Candidatus Bathyarchaeota archaeon]|nr:YegP family protein [Candidatus Bathyarchaeum sp.]
MPEPVFEWYVDNAGKDRFRLKAANGEMIATGEGYASKQGCLDGIESVKKNARKAKIVEAKEKV